MRDKEMSRRKNIVGDVTGAFGDMGILLPIVIGLVVVKGFDCATIFCWVGLVAIVTGMWAKIPMSVQPFKAATILLLCSSFPREVLFACSILLGVVFLLLGLTGKVYLLGRLSRNG